MVAPVRSAIDAWAEGGDHPIVGDVQVPTRLDPPGGSADGATKRVQTPGHLTVGQEGRVIGLKIPGERLVEFRPVEDEISVDRRQDRRLWSVGRERADE